MANIKKSRDSTSQGSPIPVGTLASDMDTSHADTLVETTIVPPVSGIEAIEASKPRSSKAQTKTSKPKTAKAKSSEPRTLKALREHVSAIETRLKRADTLTRNNVEALQTAFDALEERLTTQLGTSTAPISLNEQITALSDKLNHSVQTTEARVKKDLQDALNNPTITQLELALARSESRLEEAEAQQAEALSRIHQTIADMATAIDQRLKDFDTRYKKVVGELWTENHSLKQAVETRFSHIEQESATGLRMVGEKVASLAHELKTQTETKSASFETQLAAELETQSIETAQTLKTALGEATAQTRESLEKLRMEIDERLEVAAKAQDKTLSEQAQTLSDLNQRFDDLTARNSVSVLSTEHTQIATPPAIEPQPVTAQQPEISQTQTQQAQEQTQIQAQAKAPQTPDQAMAPANPYLATPYTPQTAPLTHTIPVNAGPENPVLAPTTDIAPQSTLPLPYEDPAYAEPTMDEARPGLLRSSAQKLKKAKKNKTTKKRIATMAAPPPNTQANMPIDSNEHIKEDSEPKKRSPLVTASMAVCLIAMGSYVITNVLGKDDANATLQNAQLANAEATFAEPLGQYTDIEAPIANTPELHAAADSGDSISEFQLGLSHLQSGDTDKALPFIRSAANKGQPAAQYRLAKMYEIGQGVEKSDATSFQLIERSARGGHRLAMHDLALYYAEGRGGATVDMTTAVAWFTKAAERGVMDSQFNLAVLAESGQGRARNLADAYVWYTIAAGQGDTIANQRLIALGEQLSPEDKKAADERIRRYKPVAIDRAANGIFNSSGETDPREPIRTAQNLLNTLGYDAGAPDGFIGPKTREAITRFQRENGLSETGQVNAELLQHLKRFS